MAEAGNHGSPEPRRDKGDQRRVFVDLVDDVGLASRRQRTDQPVVTAPPGWLTDPPLSREIRTERHAANG